MLDVIVPSELDQAPHAFDRSDVEQRQLLLGLADSRVSGFEHREEQPLLVAEVVVEHALVGAGCGGDPVYARAAEAVLGEFDGRGIEDGAARAIRIALRGCAHRRSSGWTTPRARARGSGRDCASHACILTIRLDNCKRRPCSYATRKTSLPLRSHQGGQLMMFVHPHYFECVGAAGLAHRLANRDHDQVAALDLGFG